MRKTLTKKTLSNPLSYIASEINKLNNNLFLHNKY